MNVTENTVKNLDDFLIERQEADIVACLADKMNVSTEEALTTYYESDLAIKLEQGELGIQYLPPDYLADEVIKRETSKRPEAEASEAESEQG